MGHSGEDADGFPRHERATGNKDQVLPATQRVRDTTENVAQCGRYVDGGLEEVLDVVLMRGHPRPQVIDAVSERLNRILESVHVISRLTEDRAQEVRAQPRQRGPHILYGALNGVTCRLGEPGSVLLNRFEQILQTDLPLGDHLRDLVAGLAQRFSKPRLNRQITELVRQLLHRHLAGVGDLQESVPDVLDVSLSEPGRVSHISHEPLQVARR